MALVLAFFLAENENRKLEDLPLADFGRLTERLLLSVRTKSINHENFVNWNYDHCCFCYHDSKHFSISRVRVNTLYDPCYLGIVDSFFHSLMKSDFLLRKGLLCIYDKQNNTWLLVDMESLFSCSTRHLMEFLFPCLTRHLNRSLRSLVSYWVKHSKRNSISTHVPCLYVSPTSSCPSKQDRP